MIAKSHFPATYQAADAAAEESQTRFLLTVGIRLGGYLAAAIGGAFTLQVSSLDLMGLLALLGLLAALGAEIYTLSTQPDRTWYEGRAAAESAKTLTWRYMVGGDPLGLEQLSGEDADKLFIREIRGLFTDLDDIEVAPVASASHQITPLMRTHRASTLQERRSFYDIERIEDQRVWYTNEANENEVNARNFEIASVALQVSGVVAAALKAFGAVDLDWLGIIGAAGAALLSWSQARQYRSLASAYAVAAQELASIRSLLHHERDESEWARFVDESEEAISREHTLWRASRGVRT